jgi:hypothetical protein
MLQITGQGVDFVKKNIDFPYYLQSSSIWDLLEIFRLANPLRIQGVIALRTHQNYDYLFSKAFLNVFIYLLV